MGSVFSLAAAAFPLLLVVLALRPVTDRELTAFSVRYRLADDVTSPMLSRAIARSRGLRLLGAALGFSLPSLIRAVTHGSLNTGSALWWGLTGYLGGALVAVLVPIAPAGDALRAAALVPRRARDYLPRRTLLAPAVTVALTLLAALGFASVPRHAEEASRGLPWGAVVVSLVAALVAYVGAGLVVRRRQSVPDPDVLAVDDALRSHALHLVFGTGITVGALAASVATLRVRIVASVDVVQWICLFVGLAEAWLAIVACGGFRNDGWRVRPKVPR